MKHVPNILSLIRIMMAPVIAVVYATAARPRLWTAMLYAAACATDVIDGYIARKYNAISNLGRILDPMGDKLMSVTVMGCLAVDGRAPMWIFLTLFAKELLQTVGSYIVGVKMKAEMPPSNIFGKAATVCIFLAGVLFLAVDVPRPAMDIIAAAVIATSLAAFVNYYLKYRKLDAVYRASNTADNK